MPFNFTRKYDFVSSFTLEETNLEVVYTTKLLGLTLTSDCRWDQNTSNIVQKGNSRLWFLRRLKLLGASKETLKDIYKLFCRSKLEFGAPVWAGSLTARNKADIERVQRNALRIISGSPSARYEELLKTLELDNLDSRREQICLKFARECLKSKKFSSWFSKGLKTRSGVQYYTETETKTKRHRNSPIPYLTRLLNKHAHT